MTADEILRKTLVRKELLSLIAAASQAITNRLAVGDCQGYNGQWMSKSVDEHLEHARAHLEAGELDAALTRLVMAKAREIE